MKMIIVIYSVIICILLTGCTNDKMNKKQNLNVIPNRNQDKIEKEPDELATKEFLLDTFQLTEDEIAFYKVEELILYLGLTESYFLEEKEYIDDFSIIIRDLNTLKENKEQEANEKNYDFSYLVKVNEYQGDFPNMDTIRYLSVSHQLGDGSISFFMDFEKNIIYDSYASNHIYNDIRYAEKEIVLTEDKKSEIIKALEDAIIWEWEYSYFDNTEHDLENWWHMGVEFENGAIVSYKGAGAVPENYMSLREILFQR